MRIGGNDIVYWQCWEKSELDSIFSKWNSLIWTFQWGLSRGAFPFRPHGFAKDRPCGL